MLNPGLNDVAPLGQTRWPEQRWIVGELELRAEVDALKRLQTDCRQGLHPPLDALMEPQVKIDTSPFFLSPIETEWKAALLPSSPGFDATGDRAFKGEL
jgi:hypothetical protein